MRTTRILGIASITFALTILGTATVAIGATWTVLPDGTGDAPTIQAAVDAAGSGDVIQLGDGVFTGDGNRDIELRGKRISVRSDSGNPQACVIDCEGSPTDSHRGFFIHQQEPRATIVSGITIQNAYMEAPGGGMRIENADPTIQDCIFIHNYSGTGGGVYCRGADVLLVGCYFVGNVASNRGGALDCHLSNDVQVTQCTFSENSADSGSGIGARRATATVSHSILSRGQIDSAVYCEDSIVTLSCSDVFGNPGGDWTECISGQEGVRDNFSLDPLFCDPAGEDFRLGEDSPCLAWNSPCGESVGATGLLCDNGSTGACCLTGGCTQLPRSGCEYSGGIFSGEGAGCEPSPCTAAGACCRSDNICLVMPELPCYFLGGTFLGEGALCIPSPCPDIVVTPDGTGDFPTIQAAIDEAPDGHTIQLANGSFIGPGNRNIVLGGRSIVLRSQSGNPDSCFIDCEAMDAGLTIASDGGSGAPRLESITIMSALGTAISFANISPSLIDLHVAGNYGAGIEMTGAFPEIDRCVVVGNSGPGIVAHSSGFTLRNCTVSDNASPDFGGGIRAMGTPESPTFILIENSIVWDNCAPVGEQVFLSDESTGVSFLCSSTEPSEVLGLGTIVYSGPQVEGDPLLCSSLGCGDPTNDGTEYLLLAGSPCLPEESPCGQLVGARVEGCDPGPQTHIVTADGTGDFPTIQAAIDGAADGDSIHLANGAFTGPGNKNIEFRGKRLTVASQSGDPSQCVIDCEGTESAPAKGFRFAAGEDSTSILRDIGITGAWSAERGAALEVVGSSPQLIGLRFTGNRGPGKGTACYIDVVDSDDSRVRLIKSCTFEDNDGPTVIDLNEGEATAEIVDCRFLANRGQVIGWGETTVPGPDTSPTAEAHTLRGTAPGDSIRIRSSEFIGNSDGACVGATAGYDLVIIRDCEFDSNDRGISFASHYSEHEVWRIERSRFRNHSGRAVDINQTDRTTIEESHFEGNLSGALVLDGESVKHVHDCTFYSNHSPIHGGAIWIPGPNAVLDIARSDFVSNSSDQSGGAIGINDIDLNVDAEILDCSFLENSAESGGAVSSVGSSAVIAIEGSLFAGNTATDCGGAIEDYGLAFQLSRSVLIGNSAPVGGAISNGSHTSVISSSTFVSNSASAGAQISGSPYSLEFSQSIVAFGDGPALAFDQWQPDIRCTDIYGNAGGDWTGDIAPFFGMDGNISSNPLFCDITHEDLTLSAMSPCLAGNNDCDTMGALEDPGCEERAGAVFRVQPDGLGDRATIQAAIDIAAAPDTVSLADGVFTGPGNRNLDLHGMAIFVGSESGNPADCIIDCEGSESDPHRGFTLSSGETPSSVVEGITIRNGAAFGDGVDRFGGAIYCSGSSPTIRGCILEGNAAERNGGAINLFDSEARIEDCIIRSNDAPLGAGINASSSSPTIVGTQISGNYASEGGGGVRIYGQLSTASRIEQSTISANLSDNGGGILTASGCSLSVTNSIVWSNCAIEGSDFHLDGNSSVVTVNCSDVDLNGVSFDVGSDFSLGTGNFSDDPLFCGPLGCLETPSAAGEFTLDAASPCLDADGCGLVGAFGEGCDVVSDAPPLSSPPTSLRLSASPNPSTGNVTLRLAVPEGPLEVAVFDAAGKRIRTLLREPHYSAGEYALAWDGETDVGHLVASGVYFCRATSGSQTQTLQLVTVRQ